VGLVPYGGKLGGIVGLNKICGKGLSVFNC